ncbi:hypothetical protein ACFL7D_03585 [candidate division KSB1 bacterium]
MKTTTTKPQGKFFINPKFKDLMNFPNPNSSYISKMHRTKGMYNKNYKVIAKYFGETDESKKSPVNI